MQASSYTPAASYGVATSSVARHLFDLADWRPSAWIVPLGASGHPGSPHYADQGEDWAQVRLRPIRYNWGDIRREPEHHLVISPDGAGQ